MTGSDNSAGNNSVLSFLFLQVELDRVAARLALEVAARLLAEHAYVVNEVVADRIASREQAVCVVLGVHQALRPPEGDNRAVAAETKLVGNDAAYSDRPTNQI